MNVGPFLSLWLQGFPFWAHLLQYVQRGNVVNVFRCMLPARRDGTPSCRGGTGPAGERNAWKREAGERRGWEWVWLNPTVTATATAQVPLASGIPKELSPEGLGKYDGDFDS